MVDNCQLSVMDGGQSLLCYIILSFCWPNMALLWLHSSFCFSKAVSKFHQLKIKTFNAFTVSVRRVVPTLELRGENNPWKRNTVNPLEKHIQKGTLWSVWPLWSNVNVNVLVPILLHLILYQHTQVLTCLCKSMSIVSGCSQSKLCEGEILEQYYLISVQLSWSWSPL